MDLLGLLIVPMIVILLTSIKIINQYERGVLFFLGKYQGILNPGLNVVIPILQTFQKVDIRTKAVDVPQQEAITKDNVSTKISAVLYYKIIDASKAILEVENFYFAVDQLAQTTMRNIVGEVDLNELLANRDQIAQRIKEIVESTSKSWGLEIMAVELKDIILPDSMVRTMAKRAEAERERQATIINSEGEVSAAENLARAAHIMSAVPGALHLRTLNSINDISSDQSNTVVFAVPMEVLQAVEGLGKYFQKKSV